MSIDTLKGCYIIESKDSLSNAMRTVSLSSCVTCTAPTGPWSVHKTDTHTLRKSEIVANIYTKKNKSLCMKQHHVFLTSRSNKTNILRNLNPSDESRLTWRRVRCAVQLYNFKLQLLVCYRLPLADGTVSYPYAQLWKLICHYDQEFKDRKGFWEANCYMLKEGDGESQSSSTRSCIVVLWHKKS